jgi:hypothetical protein
VLSGLLLLGEVPGGISASGAKLVPGWGSAIGAVSLSAIGAAASYAIGKVFVRHFEAGDLGELPPGAGGGGAEGRVPRGADGSSNQRSKLHINGQHS